jgi:hypothetical protein
MTPERQPCDTLRRYVAANDIPNRKKKTPLFVSYCIRLGRQCTFWKTENA